MADSALLLVGERGAAATSMELILQHSGAPRGSVYHHFPKGRTEVIHEAIKRLRPAVLELVDQMDEVGLLAAVDGLVDDWRRRLEATEFRAGCAVVAVAIEWDDDRPELAATAAGVFQAWRATLTLAGRDQGLPDSRAESLASLVVAAIEGAVILCRAERSLDPLEDVGRELQAVVVGALRACDRP